MNCPRFLMALALPVFLSVPLLAQDAEATGTSVLTVAGGSVTAFGETQLDYASAVYYDLGATIVLLQGSSPDSLSGIGQDDELAPNRALVSGQVYGSVSPGQFYAAQTAHYMDLAYEVGGYGYDDEYGFSYLTEDDDWENIDQVAPDIQVYIGSDEIDFGDTFDYGASPDAILSSPLMSDVLYDAQDNGDGTYDITLSSEAYSTLFEDGYVSSTTITSGFTLCPFQPEVCAVVVGGAVVYYGARLVVDSGMLQYIWNVFSQRIPSPVGWLGWDPQTGPAGWTKVTTPNADVAYVSPDGTKSAHPDLGHEDIGPHWDYTDKLRKPKSWRIWPDGKMSPK
jgi:hypothetical protein